MSKRTIQDKIISGLNSFRYFFSEPIKLRIARLKYEKEYNSANEKPLISVYTPTYNRGKLLIERAVKSVLNQTYENFEFIIIGDNCTDDTGELVSTIDDSRIKFYNIPKRGKRYPETVENHWFAGPVVAANTALKMVKGKWIARIDDDDIWTPDHLEILLYYAQENNYEFVSSSMMSERYGKKILVDVKNDNPRIGGTQTWLYRLYLRFFKYNINCWRKSWNKVNDIDLQVRMHQAGVRMGFLDKVTAYILPRPGEKTIGLDAYKETKNQKLKHFHFQK